MALTHDAINNASSTVGSRLTASIFTDLNYLLENDEGIDTAVSSANSALSTLSSAARFKNCSSCSGTCNTSCLGSCYWVCGGTCTGGCTGSCTSACTGECAGGT